MLLTRVVADLILSNNNDKKYRFGTSNCAEDYPCL